MARDQIPAADVEARLIQRHRRMSEPLRLRAMGLCLEAACKLEVVKCTVVETQTYG